MKPSYTDILGGGVSSRTACLILCGRVMQQKVAHVTKQRAGSEPLPPPPKKKEATSCFASGNLVHRVAQLHSAMLACGWPCPQIIACMFGRSCGASPLPQTSVRPKLGWSWNEKSKLAVPRNCLTSPNLTVDGRNPATL